MDDETVTPECGDCGQGFLIGDGKDVGEGSPVCESCADEYAKCAGCDGWNKKDDLSATDDGVRCESCRDDYYTCEDCDTVTHCDNMRSTEQETTICEACCDRNYTWSEPQETYIRDRVAVRAADSDEYASRSWAVDHWYMGSDDEWYSDSDNCPSDDDDDSVLHDYGINVLNECQYDRQAVESGALVFGVELEMEARDGSASDIVDALGGRTGDAFILKDDGSLNDGAELVTIPMTLDGHRSDFGWADKCERARRVAKSGVGTTNCGIHVHINKRALTPLQIGKMLVFLNSPALRENVDTIAQRPSNGYCTRSEKKIKDGAHRSADRYDVVNVGGATVEIRMFRGNLRHERVLKNIEFCHALVTYCADASIATIEQWAVFADWLLKRRGQYPELIKFLDGASVPGFQNVVKVKKDETKEVLQCA